MKNIVKRINIYAGRNNRNNRNLHVYFVTPKLMSMQPMPMTSSITINHRRLRTLISIPSRISLKPAMHIYVYVGNGIRKCNIITPELVMNVVNDNQELRNIILAQNRLIMEHTQAFQQQITDLIPKLNSVNLNHQVVASTTTNNTTIHHTHNTQNTFNLNIFLNEKCKDAWNMSDFIDSLKVTIDDLMVTRERGIGESIGRILVQGLSTLDVYKRPIHCTD